jgi:hypothetical protein
MLHPHMTAELVRQRRAALDAEAGNQRLVRQLQPIARPDPERGTARGSSTSMSRRRLAPSASSSHQASQS